MKFFWGILLFVAGAIAIEFGLDAFIAFLVGVTLGGLGMAWMVAHDG